MTAPDLFRTLYERAPIPMVTVRDDGRVVDANAAFCDASRSRHEDLVNADFVDQITAQDRGASRVFLRQALDRESAEWGVSLSGAPEVRWKVRAVGFLGRVVVLMLWTPSSQDVPRTLVPALAALMRRVPGQAVLLLSQDLWVLGAWGLPEVEGGDDSDVLGRHLSQVAEGDDAWLAELGACLAAAEGWHGRISLTPEGGRGLVCVADMIPSQVVGGSRQGAGFVVLRPAPHEDDSHRDRRRLDRMARIGDFTVALVDGVRDRMRVASLAEAGSPQDRQARAEIHALDRRLKQFTEVARTDGTADLGAVMDATRSRWTEYLVEQDIEFVVEPFTDLVRVGLTGEIAGDVLDELIENARVALTDAKERRIVLRTELSDGVAMARVEDSGPGITRAHRETVFRPFHTRWPGRLGLGLSAARTQVELRGGQLAAVDPVSGKGAAFVFTLPLIDPDSEAVAATPVRADGRRRPVLEGRSVLLVEEAEELRTALVRILTESGMQVREAWSGRSALAELSQRGPTDLAVSGLRFDDGAAARFLGEIREAFPQLGAHIVVLGDAGAARERRVIEQRLGCPVVSHPILVHELLERLETLAGSMPIP